MVVWGFQVLHSLSGETCEPRNGIPSPGLPMPHFTLSARLLRIGRKTTPPMWQKHPGQLSAWGNTSPQTQVWRVASFHFRISLEGRHSCTNWSDSNTCYSSHLCCNTIFTSVFFSFQVVESMKIQNEIHEIAIHEIDSKNSIQIPHEGLVKDAHGWNGPNWCA